ncbi:D-tyrosyl-tRNA(Tyr) deacylase [Sulfurivirga caldicuralii]|uniref:D-aminoacyl-tRNA deacylase n=1 Tax=Sulfurivirga caldicuralii TaxID=364032 RepID=A0A1N6DF63_9GAMM|nr:D-aminoacyl-tRNA deacylase [Sulfurivirga caldicuralii]SIN69432.1 D-tyrosyl-tRNA(Tyr) deacylase [Sulfurivirga caldicuralii]
MICLIQRACHGKVDVAGETVGEIGYGMVVLVGFQRGDDSSTLEKMAHRLLHYRLFADEQDRMNLNVQQIDGEILLVPQFTLAADTRKGLRPNFTPAAPPKVAAELFERFAQQVRTRWPKIATGRFGAHMQVSLCNDGPVTFWLQVDPSDG